jgi:hypothetical protein
MKPKQKLRNWITIERAAELLCVPVTEIRDLVNSQQLAYIIVQGKCQVSLTSLAKIAAREEK